MEGTVSEQEKSWFGVQTRFQHALTYLLLTCFSLRHHLSVVKCFVKDSAHNAHWSFKTGLGLCNGCFEALAHAPPIDQSALEEEDQQESPPKVEPKEGKGNSHSTKKYDKIHIKTDIRLPGTSASPKDKIKPRIIHKLGTKGKRL